MVRRFQKLLKCGYLVGLIFVGLLGVSMADGITGQGSVTTADIMLSSLTHFIQTSQPKLIGVCFWWRCQLSGCGIYSTPELDEYLPDLVVSVYNSTGTNPWVLEKNTLDPVSHSTASALVKGVLHLSISNGRQSMTGSTLKLYSKSVDVVGNPAMVVIKGFKGLVLRADTTPFMPYYQSNLDIMPSRSGVAEALEPQSFFPVDPIGKNLMSHWGYEFPRSFTLEASSDYKASLMCAQHAADIVTNLNMLHVVHATKDSCGTNCAVANVVATNASAHEKWQEIYPKKRFVNIGRVIATPVSQGASDEAKGKGNYVFILWRHYRGCVQGKHFILATVPVKPTHKR